MAARSSSSECSRRKTRDSRDALLTSILPQVAALEGRLRSVITDCIERRLPYAAEKAIRFEESRTDDLVFRRDRRSRDDSDEASVGHSQKNGPKRFLRSRFLDSRRPPGLTTGPLRS